jgi:stage V sporulation protein AE
VLIDKTKLTPARVLVLYVVVGVFLTALGLYDKLSDIGGIGASLPLTGFGNALARGVKEAVRERGVLGALTGGLAQTSAGIAASMILAFLAALVFKSKHK